MIEAAGIIGSIAFQFDGFRLRLVWMPMTDEFFTSVARGKPLRTVVLQNWLEIRRHKGRVEARRERARRGYHRNKELIA